MCTSAGGEEYRGRGGEGVTPHVYIRTYTISFHVVVLWLSCFICSNLTSPSFENINETNFCCFYFKLFFRTKVNQSTVNFN